MSKILHKSSITGLCLAFLCLLLIFCSNTQANEIFENELLVGNMIEWGNVSVYSETKVEHIKLVHSKGKSIIPILIKYIDIEVETYNGLMVIDSLFQYPYFRLSEYYGVFFAYLIDLILAKEEIFIPNVRPLYYLTDTYKYETGLLYDYCKIAPSDVLQKNKRKYIDLKYSDIKKIKEFYSKWWKKNKNKSLEKLREDYKNGVRPLANSGYEWF